MTCVIIIRLIIWRHENGEYKTDFSSAQTWNQIRIRKNKVPWSKLVWFSQAVPVEPKIYTKYLIVIGSLI